MDWEASMDNFNDDEIRAVHRAIRQKSMSLIRWYIQERGDWEWATVFMIAQKGYII